MAAAVTLMVVVAVMIERVVATAAVDADMAAIGVLLLMERIQAAVGSWADIYSELQPVLMYH